MTAGPSQPKGRRGRVACASKAGPSLAWRARDAHERQADATGRRFARGEGGLSAGLTPAPAAAILVPGSIGLKPPAHLLASLEQAFDADLAALRFHSDAPAQAAAQRIGALAFASGSSIYFGPGRWSPDSVVGRALIGHEVAHTLQQTRRVGAGGRWRLEPAAAGEAGVQRDTDPNEAVEAAKDKLAGGFDVAAKFAALGLLAPETGIDSCLSVVDRHLQLPADAAAAALASRLRIAVTGKSVEAATAAVKEITDGLDDASRTERATSLLCDCFKALGADAEAVAIAGAKMPADTAFGSWSFYAAGRGKDLSWLLPLLKAHPVAGNYYPNAVVAVARIDFYGMARGALNLDAEMKFDSKMSEAIAAALRYGPLMANERKAVALRALAAFDSVRLLPFRGLAMAQKGKRSLLERFDLKLAMINQYTDPDFLAATARKLTTDQEVIWLAADAGARIAPIAVRAVQFWDRIVTTAAASAPPAIDADAAVRTRSDALQEAIRARLPSIKPLAKVEQRLIEAMNRAARLEDGGLPSPKAMAANLAAAADMVEKITYQIDGDLARRDKKLVVNALPEIDPDATDGGAVDVAITDDTVYGVMLVSLYQLQHRLLSDYARPERSDDEDIRIGQRDAAAAAYQLALGRFFNFATLFGYPKLSGAAVTAYQAKQAGVRKSFVGLLAPFALDPAKLEEFAKDFPASDVKGLPVSGTAFIQMVYAVYYGMVLDKLKAALAAPSGSVKREFDYSEGLKPIVNTAIEGVKQDFKPPQRFRVPKASTILFVRPEDRDDVAKLVKLDAGTKKERDHPVKRALLSTLTVNQIAVTPHDFKAHVDGFVMWVLDDMNQLADRLADIPGVVDLERGDKSLLGYPDAFPGGPASWLLELGKLTENNAAMRKLADDAVKTWMETEQKSLEGPLRRATNNYRRTVGPMIAAQWERVQVSFLKDPNAFFEAPREAMQLTLVFAAGVQPATPEEQRLQMTALMLELAPVLTRKLGTSTHFGDLVTISGTQRFDIVLPLYAYVDGAATFAANPANAGAFAKLDMGFTPDDLDRRTRILRTLAGEFTQTVKQHQTEMVVEGLPSENLLRVPGRGYPMHGDNRETQEPGPAFITNGVAYQLVEIYHGFRYEPEMHAQASPIDWQAKAIGTRNLTVDGKEVSATDPPIPLLKIVRTAFGGSPVEIVISSDDTRMLSELAYALDIHITMEGLNDLAGMLTEFAGVLTLAIQLAFPEFAPAIAAAEIGGTIIQFWGSGEFATVKAALSGDVGQVFQRGLDQIRTDLTLDKLWDYLLFDVTPPTFAVLEKGLQLSGRLSAVSGTRGDDVKKSSIKRVIGPILGAGAKLVVGARSVHDHTSFAARKVELAVQGSPWAAMILRVIARNLHRLEGVSLAELAADSAIDAIERIQQVYRRFETILAGLENFELPDELVPLEAIIEMVLNFIIDRLPIKYRLPLQGVRGVVNATPLRKLYDELFKAVADELREVGIDPNFVWRDYAKAAINPYLKQAAHGISDEIQALLVRVPALKSLGTMNVPEVAASFVTGEIAPKVAAAGALPIAPPLLPTGAGAALGAGDRVAAQRGYGHDFSHVRIHRGTPVDTGLRTAGAVAATSGSHVYLDSRIGTGSGQGRDVLHHELAHVLQQTGSRPLGARHSAQAKTAIPARREPRWRIDRGAEAQADRLSREARQPATRPRPVSHATGVQPSFTDVVEKFFLKLGDPSALIANAEELTKKGTLGLAGSDQPKADDLNRAAPGLKAGLLAKLIEALNDARKGTTGMTFKAPFDAAKTKILDYVVTNRKEELEAIPKILPHALKQVERKQDAGSATAKTEKVWILDVGRLETILEEFFFGITGLSVDVELHTKRFEAPDGKQRDMVDMDKPFKTLNATYLHLPMIGGGASIWDVMIDSNFPTAGAKRPTYQAKTRLALEGLQPSPTIFAEKTIKGVRTLVFGAKTLELIESYVNPPPSRNLPGDECPKWTDYIGTDSSSTVGKYGQIGLRLGFYRDRDKPSQQKGTDRASHHTVQFLLLEYLVNTKDRHQPFPHALSLYPNIVPSGGEVKIIGRTPGAASGIKVSDNVKGRGENMPTILLSVHAHTLGDVHVSPKPDDLPSAGPSQGSAIHGIFRSKLDKYRDVVSNKAGLQAMAAKRDGRKFDLANLPQVDGREVTPDLLSTAIFNATCQTYTWMRDHMNTKLETALNNHEMDYYTSLVATATSTSIYADKKPQPGYLPDQVGSAIMVKVKEKQKETLESSDFGFEPMP